MTARPGAAADAYRRPQAAVVVAGAVEGAAPAGTGGLRRGRGPERPRYAPLRARPDEGDGVPAGPD
ncbi:hypothetical protein, partial [Streptomyces cinereoruber]|uniref:hypothetical protein n=1 Tax=Streptomyces cinereoruber TaxID=67260 RepID=UPI003634C6BF